MAWSQGLRIDVECIGGLDYTSVQSGGNGLRNHGCAAAGERLAALEKALRFKSMSNVERRPQITVCESYLSNVQS